MPLLERCLTLNWISESDADEVRKCLAALPAAPKDYRALAAGLAKRWKNDATQCIGLGGGQGAGKSTLSQLLASATNFYGESLAVLSLDDFYLSKAEREHLARVHHPLFDTRGPPGTHDIERLLATIKRLQQGLTVDLPVFDKGKDDRVGETTIPGPVDRILVEGWCVGATPIPVGRLSEDPNELERQHDPQGAWRASINSALANPYAKLNSILDSLLFLQVPGMESVRRWRLQQEQQRLPEQRMNSQEINQFVMYFERVTGWMLETLPTSADTVVVLAEDHSVSTLRRNN